MGRENAVQHPALEAQQKRIGEHHAVEVCLTLSVVYVISFLTSVLHGRYIKNIQEVQDGAAKITAIAWSHNNMKLAVCTADRVLSF